MAEFLTLAGSVLVARESASRSTDPATSQLNEIQCNRLWSTIRVVYDYLSSSQLPTPHNKRHKYLPNVFREFYLIVTRADAIVPHFRFRHLWLTAAVLQGNHRLAFKELTRDLQACVSVFADIAQHPVPFDASGTIWRRDVDMESDARMDAESLRIRVEGILARPDSDENERLLAQYLLDRDRSMSSSDNQDEDHPQFFMANDGYPTQGRPIGRGASGEVLEMEWLGMPCAKKLFSASTEDKEYMKECLKEVSILAQLSHPHIVKLLCTNVHSEVSFLMELMPMSLFDFLKKRWGNPQGIQLPAAVDLMLQIARGMEYLHEQGVVHRDLKSSNILVTPSKFRELRELGYGDVKLTDFGLAKIQVHELTNPTRKKIGTPRWMAPEAHVADGAMDWKKADAYSFAMTCAEILTGKIPFSCERPSTVYARIMRRKRQVKIPSSRSKALDSLLEQCSDTRPSARQSFTTIRETLTSVKAGFLKFEWNDRYPRRILERVEAAEDSLPGLLLYTHSHYKIFL